MSDNNGLDNAAVAFDAAMGNRAAPSNDKEPDEKPIETMFDNLGEFTPDGDEVAGGDDQPLEGKKPASGDEPAEDEGGEFELDEDGNVVLDDDGLPVLKAKEEDDADASDDILDRKFVVTVDGEETEVPLKEALAGYIRQETFHRRLNKLDEASRVVHSRAEEVITAQNSIAAQYDLLQKQINELLPEEPDWDKLYAEDPARARQIEKQYQEIKTKVEGVAAKRDEALKQAEELSAKQFAEFARSEYPKFVQIAKWKDQNGMKTDITAMRTTALQSGFTEQEISEVVDHRMLSILLKASKYDRIMAARPKAVQAGKPSKRPSNSSGAGNRTAPKGIERAKQRLTRTGSVDDAAAVFTQMLK